MRRRLLFPTIAIAVLGVAACESPTSTVPATAPSLARANTIKTNERLVIVDATVTDPCSGEDILLSGKAHLVQTTTDNGDGTGTVSLHINYAGISGFGLTNGLKYNLVATAKQRDITTAVGYATTVQEQLGLISQGPSDNFKARIKAESSFDGTNFTDITFRNSETCN
jgi:hypothetical protein